MTDVVGKKATRDGRESRAVVDVDVHEMLTSVKDLVPYLDEPWRGRVAVDDGFKGPPGNPYSFPQAAGVAIQDAVTDDVSPAGSKASSGQPQRGTAVVPRFRGERRHVLCGRDDIPAGTVRGFRAGGRKLALARLDDGSFRAVADTCPHQAAQLSLGSIERMWVSDTPGTHHRSESRNVLLCPWHGFEFDLETGGDPCVPGRPDLKLKTYRVGVEDGEVVVYL